VFRVLLVLSLALPWAAAPASAGTYQVYSCRTPAGMLAPTDGWEGIPGHAEGATDNCAFDDDLVVRSLDQRENTGVYTGFHYGAMANTSFSKLTFWRYATATHFDDAPEHSWAAWIGTGSAAHTEGFELCGLSCSHKGDHSSTAIIDGNRLDKAGLVDVHDVYVVAGCVGQPGWGCNVAHDAGGGVRGYGRIEVQGLQAEVTDPAAPVVETATGALAESGVHTGIQALTFGATDKGGGLYHATLELKRPGQQWAPVVRQIVDGNEGRCAELDYLTTTDREFGFRRPCLLSATEELSFDTRGVPDGVYQLRASVEDVAGNTTTVLPERSFEIDNVPPPSPSTPPTVTGPPRLAGTLQATRGAWTGADNRYATAWMRCTARDAASCAAITGATADSYKPMADDLGRFLRVSVTASNAEGSTTALSEPVGPITDEAGATEPKPATTATPTPTAAPTPGAGAPGGGGGSDAPAVGNGVHAAADARLTLSGPASLRLGFRRSGWTRVTLRDGAGRAISGASIAVLERMATPGQQFVPAHSSITTDADGSVRYPIEPGYSRTLRFAYSPTLGGAATIVRDLRITVPSRTSLRVDKTFLRNGQAVRFLGTVLSRPVPASGVVIDLQARVGNHWQTFNSIRTNSAGRWHAGYRFRSTSGLQTYSFRARVRGDTGFPYAPSRSKKITVRVKG
jgi:hypothetical protein